MEPRDNPEHLVEEGLARIRDAAQFLGVSVAQLYVFMGRGDLPFVKLGKSRRIPRRALIELAARNLIARREDDRQ
jgi:excisionase family DNA binding protein